MVSQDKNDKDKHMEDNIHATDNKRKDKTGEMGIDGSKKDENNNNNRNENDDDVMLEDMPEL